jgi:hypothetical protein
MFHRISAFPIETRPVPLAFAGLATASLTPPLVWLMVTAARGARPRGRYWALAWVVLVIVAGLVVLRADWIGAVVLLCPLALIYLRPVNRCQYSGC